MNERWIVIPGWDKFQHYKDRNPAWIKVYTELESRDEWRQLTLAERGLLVSIWLEYARSNSPLRASDLHALVSAPTRTQHLEALNHAGFIEVSASKPLAQRKRQREKNPSRLPKESLEGSSLEESQKPAADPDELLRRALDFAADWQGGPSEVFDEAIDDLERELHAQLTHSQRSRLWDEALRRDRRTA